jgi:hypothetical protein
MLLFCLGCPFTAAATATKDCSLKKYATLELDVTGRNIRVPAAVNGRDGTMVLNLGSAFSIVNGSIVEEMKLPRRKLPGGAQLYANGVRLTEYAEIDSLVIGGVNFGKATIVINETTPRSETIGGIGLDVFGRSDFELHLAQGKLHLFSQDHCPGQVVYWTNEYSSAPFVLTPFGALHFPMEIEGIRVQAELSPSNAVSVLRADATRALFDFDEFSPGMEVQEYTGEGAPKAFYRAMRITAPGLDIANTKVEVRRFNDRCALIKPRKDRPARYGSECDGAFPLAVGRNVLEALRIYFAMKEKVMYFSRADATK